MTIDNINLNKPSNNIFLILHKRRNEFTEQIHTIVRVSQELNLRSENQGKAPWSLFLMQNKFFHYVGKFATKEKTVHFPQKQVGSLAIGPNFESHSPHL